MLVLKKDWKVSTGPLRDLAAIAPRLHPGDRVILTAQPTRGRGTRTGRAVPGGVEQFRSPRTPYPKAVSKSGDGCIQLSIHVRNAGGLTRSASVGSHAAERCASAQWRAGRKGKPYCVSRSSRCRALIDALRTLVVALLKILASPVNEKLSQSLSCFDQHSDRDSRNLLVVDLQNRPQSHFSFEADVPDV